MRQEGTCARARQREVVEGLAGSLAAGERVWASVQLRLACLQAAAAGLGDGGAAGDRQWAGRALGRLQAAAANLRACMGPSSQREAVASGAPGHALVEQPLTLCSSPALKRPPAQACCALPRPWRLRRALTQPPLARCWPRCSMRG